LTIQARKDPVENKSLSKCCGTKIVLLMLVTNSMAYLNFAEDI